MTYAAPDELDEPDDEPMFGQFAELCGVVLGVVVLGVVVLGDVVVPPPEAAQAAPPLAERATAATAATWRTRTIGYLLCRILRSNQWYLSAVAENAVNVLRTPYLGYGVVRWKRVSEAEGGEMLGTATARPRYGVSWLVVIYLVAGGIVAATHHYWSNLHTLKAIISAVLATLLWPLLLVGVNLHIH